MKTHYMQYMVSLFLIISCKTFTDPIDTYFWDMLSDKQNDIYYNSIYFSDENNGWICGSSGTIKHTTNGGRAWEIQTSGVSETLNDVYFLDDLNGWVCSYNTILNTHDGGKIWNMISIPNQPYLFYNAVKFPDENNGWISTASGEVLHTTDGGLFWDVQKISDEHSGSRFSVLDNQTVYLLSNNDTLYKTLDSGKNWQKLEAPVPIPYAPSDMFFLDVLNGWISTISLSRAFIRQSPVLFTQDGGDTWTYCILDVGSTECVYFLNKKVGWIAGSQSIYKTTDGGMNWDIEYSPDDSVLAARDIYFFNKKHGWILGSVGDIYKYGVAK